MSIGLLVLLAAANQAFAQTAASRSAQAAEDRKLGSVHLRCDGLPPHRSAADVAARLVLIMATAGLSGPGEMADKSKRLTGADGVSACDRALEEETDPTRKVQLTLARAVHHIETKDFEAALADARSAPALAGEAANEVGFRHSLLLSAMDLEAAALVRLGRSAEAEAVAVKMAAVSPYDLIAQQRARTYSGLTGELSAEKLAYLDRFARLHPPQLTLNAVAHEWAGQFAESAADLGAYVDLAAGYATADKPPKPLPATVSHRAIVLALAGDMDKSNSLAAETRLQADELLKSGKAADDQAAVNAAEESLDFQAVLADLAAGKAAQARAKFLGRSRWVVPSAAVVAEVAKRLRAGAPAGELTGALANDPAIIRSNALAAAAGAIVQAANANDVLYAYIRTPMSESDYSHWNDDVWNTKDSPFLLKKNDKVPLAGEVFTAARSNGIATGDALMMHCALMARARGVAGFVLFPGRTRLDTVYVRFGNPGDPGIPQRAILDAATVIAALSEEFPDPSLKQPAKK